MSEPTPVEPWPVPDETLISEALAGFLLILGETAPHLEAAVLELTDAKPSKKSAKHPAFIHDLAVIVDALETHLDKIKTVQAFVGETLCRELPYQTAHVGFADTRALVPRWGGNRTAWSNDRLQEDVQSRILFDEEGTAREDPKEVLNLAWSVVSLNGSNVKTTGLRALGLNPDDYAHQERKPPTIQVMK